MKQDIAKTPCGALQKVIRYCSDRKMSAECSAKTGGNQALYKIRCKNATPQQRALHDFLLALGAICRQVANDAKRALQGVAVGGIFAYPAVGGPQQPASKRQPLLFQ
ncbi:hypothetical protein [Comamonas odontotermitis]|uniref:hypothetical protein n=1 Tax=Comamonas odontotermitis TaxID=379895 RepID=UPI0037539A83